MSENLNQQPDQKEQEPLMGSLHYPLTLLELQTLRKGGFIVYGTATMASGVATASDGKIKASSVAFAIYNTPAGTIGVGLKCICANGALTVTSIKADSSTQTLDTSTVNFLIIL